MKWTQAIYQMQSSKHWWIRMLKEITEYGNNIKEEMKFTLSKIQKNLRGTISRGEEARIQINNLKRKAEINIQPEQQEEKEFKKQGQYKDPLGHLQTYQHLNHKDARRRRGEQENGNLFEKIMKENFLNLVKEIDIQVQEAQRVQTR